MRFLPDLPEADCTLCPRLAAFRVENRAAYPDWHNDPVASFGSNEARLLVVGLAPGLQGANRTGRPFTGDYAGDLLYATLAKYGFSRGNYAARRDDGLELVDCRITNAVRCVPPQNKPTGVEARQCRRFLAAEIAGMTNLSAVMALGRIAHDNVLAALDLPRAVHGFGHNARHDIGGGRVLFDSYHCSRYNTNTGRLTTEMFEDVFNSIRRHLGGR
jgi:uracil-DNA glycosylase family 4